jgi:predicted ABC-type ATPase
VTIKVYGGANGGGKSHFQAHALQELKEWMESHLIDIDYIVFDEAGEFEHVPTLPNMGVDRTWIP